jgi:hypothetical protein
VAGLHNPLGDSGHLVGGLPGTENHFRESLSGMALVIDPGEAQILEGCLAQILKDALVRGLRRISPGPDPLQQGEKLLASHLMT